MAEINQLLQGVSHVEEGISDRGERGERGLLGHRGQRAELLPVSYVLLLVYLLVR